MGTQFSKIKVTQRVEVHGQVIHNYHPDLITTDIYHNKSNSTNNLDDLWTRHAHHSGVVSGHELMSYSFLGGQACEPRRSIRRRHRSRSSMSLPRSSSRASFKLSTLKYIVIPNGKEKQRLKELEASGLQQDTPDSELDSGISVNDNYYEPRAPNNLAGMLHYDTIDENQVNQDTVASLLCSLSEKPKKETLTMTAAIKKHYRENFSDWFEPGSQLNNNPQNSLMNRRSTRRRNLHQKLVMSQMNAKKAAKLDMDDRAKILQYFSRPVKASGDIAGPVERVKIEDMFGKCWSIPHHGPALPTIITVQAPAGIGKTSMLKYMCMKWGCQELWAENFDVLLFIECRTLNRLGPMTGRQFLQKFLEPIKKTVGDARFEYEGPLQTTTSFDEEMSEDQDLDEDVLLELTRKAAAGRVLVLLDGLDEVHGVGNLDSIRLPAGHPERPGLPGKGAITSVLQPLEFAQCLLTGSLLLNCHVIVTSRPHTLSHLQSSRWFLSLPKRMVSLDIQGLSDEGIESFIHSYVDGRMSLENDYDISRVDDERPCSEKCLCQSLQIRARSDPYIFSLATNPFYLWLICTIFTEVGEAFVPRTLTQLYTWVILVFGNRWQNTSLQITTNLEQPTVNFIIGFAKLCYHLVSTSKIKISAVLESSPDRLGGILRFPDLGNVTIDQERAEMFGLMTVAQDGLNLECEFRHLSLAEYLTALHVHITGDSLKDFPRDRKELILQYLSGLASTSDSKDQIIVRDFLTCFGTTSDTRDAISYLKSVQKMKGEWYNQQGLQKQLLFMRCAFESRQENLTLYPFPGLKVINIRGSNLLSLDLIVIGSFVTSLSDNNRLLELSLRDYPLDDTGLNGLMPCLPLVRTVTICARLIKDPKMYYNIAEACGQPKSRLRELWLLDVPPAYCGFHEGDPNDTPDELGAALNHLREVCKQNNVRVNVGTPMY